MSKYSANAEKWNADMEYKEAIDQKHNVPIGERSIVMTVCVFVRNYIFGTTRPIFKFFCVH